jgi:hypothetical protein
MLRSASAEILTTWCVDRFTTIVAPRIDKYTTFELLNNR